MAQIKDTPAPDENGHRSTTPGEGPEWVVVYDLGVELRAYITNTNGQTTSVSIVETFADQVQAVLRIGELGFLVP